MEKLSENQLLHRNLVRTWMFASLGAVSIMVVADSVWSLWPAGQGYLSLMPMLVNGVLLAAVRWYAWWRIRNLVVIYYLDPRVYRSDCCTCIQYLSEWRSKPQPYSLEVDLGRGLWRQDQGSYERIGSFSQHQINTPNNGKVTAVVDFSDRNQRAIAVSVIQEMSTVRQGPIRVAN